MITQSNTPRFTDWHEVHDAIASAYFPHELTPLTAGAASGSRLHAVELGSCRIARMHLGATVSIASDCPGAYGVNIPTSGHIESVIENATVVSGPGQATVCPPDMRTFIPEWTPSCDLLGFRIDEHYLRREMDRILARPGRCFPLQLDLRTGKGASWLKFLQFVFDQVVNDDCLLRGAAMLAQLSGALTTALVLAAVPDEEPGRCGTRPRIVKQVVDEIHGDPARPWTPGDLAEIAGVSVRRLQQGFREYVGMTPLAYLQDVRLERAHHDLVRAGHPTTVADVALRWGIMHTGRFAATYRRKYGVSPSTTLMN